MKLIILNPQKTLLETEVGCVELPGTMGRFTVLRGHDRLISTLVKGVVRYQPMEATVDDERQCVEIEGGFVEINNDVITVCAD